MLSKKVFDFSKFFSVFVGENEGAMEEKLVLYKGAKCFWIEKKDVSAKNAYLTRFW